MLEDSQGLCQIFLTEIQEVAQMSKLALKGGKKAYAGKLPQRPAWDKKEERALLAALHKTDWGGYPPPNTITNRFCAKFAKKHDSKFCFTLHAQVYQDLMPNSVIN